MSNFKNHLIQVLKGELPALDAQLQMAPEFRKEELLKQKSDLKIKNSAVLILFNPFAENLSIVFTKRSSRLNIHRGQVSFPGGRVDAADRDATATALRETWEEIGIPSSQIEIIGQLSNLYIPPTSFDVRVMLGFLKSKPIYKINPDEVEEVVEVPISQLMDPSNIKSKVFYKTNSNLNRKAPYYDVMGLEIWGATAMIISELLVCIKPFYNQPNKD